VQSKSLHVAFSLRQWRVECFNKKIRVASTLWCPVGNFSSHLTGFRKSRLLEDPGFERMRVSCWYIIWLALTRNQSATSNAIRSMLTTTSPRCRRPNTARSPSGLRSVPLRRRRSGSGFQTADRDDHSIGSIHWIVLDWIGLGGVTVAPVFN